MQRARENGRGGAGKKQLSAISGLLANIIERTTISEDEFDGLISSYTAKGEDTLIEELSKRDKIDQNVLHHAMKDKTVFKKCCDVLMKREALFAKLVKQQDKYGDTVMHQFIDFGRFEQLQHLMAVAKENAVLSGALEDAMKTKNKHDETPIDILNNGPEKSKTLKELREIDVNWPKMEKKVAEAHEKMKTFFLTRTQQPQTAQQPQQPQPPQTAQQPQNTQSPQKVGECNPEFDKLLRELKKTTTVLINKGNDKHEIYNKEYMTVAQTAATLIAALETQYSCFFEHKQIDALQFKANYDAAISKAKGEFMNHRSRWYRQNPIIRAFLGVLAALSVIPMVAIMVGAKKSYAQLFFSTPATNSQHELEAFEQGLNTATTQLLGK